MPRRPARLTLTPLEDRATPAVAGSLDPTFGTNGVVQIDGLGAGLQLSHIVPAPGGGYVASAYIYSTASPASRPSVGIVRVTPDFRLDSSFGRGGFVEKLGAYYRGDVVAPPSVLAVDASGRILIQTGASGGAAIRRLTATGADDTNFGVDGTSGVQQQPADSPIGSIYPIAAVVQPDGRIVVLGISGQGSGGLSVARLNDSGLPDTSFGTEGGVVLGLLPRNQSGSQSFGDIALHSDGGIVAAGGVAAGQTAAGVTTSDAAVVKLTASGQFDPTFGNGGRATIPTLDVDDGATAVTALADGRLMVTSGPSGYEARLTPTGSLDAGYGTNGLVTFASHTDPAAALSDGRILELDHGSDGLALAAVQRLTAEGKPDPTFSSVPLPRELSPGTAFPTPDGGAVFFGTAYDAQANSTSPVAFRVVGTTAIFPTVVGTVTLGGTPNGSFTTLVPDPAGGLPVPSAPVNVYPGFSGNARTATADVNGDGVADYVTGPGPGGGPNVVVTDGKTGAKIADFNAFETTFTGGVFVAAADLNGDGKAEVVVTPDQGGGPVVAIYDGAGLTAGKSEAAEVSRFFGIEDTNFRGGARPALGDVNGDGRPDLVVAAGFGGGPRVAVFDGSVVTDPSRYVNVTVRHDDFNPPTPHAALSSYYFTTFSIPPKLMADFFVFENTLRNGVFVAAGDLTGDGKAEVVVGGGPGGGPRVMALDGSGLTNGQMTPVVNFFAGDPAGRGGVRVAVRPAADGSMQLVTGSGEGQPGQVNVYPAAAARAGGPAVQTLSPFGDAVLADGVYVG